MKTNNEITAPAETFSAVVATPLPMEDQGFDPNSATYSGGGMGRTHDD